MEPPTNTFNKRQKKRKRSSGPKSALREMKFFAGKKTYGGGKPLEEYQYAYFIKIFEELQQVEGEEKELLVRNFLNGLIEDKEVKLLATNQIVSRILDDALQYGEVSQVLLLSEVFVEDLRITCLDPYASHVLQTLMALSFKFIQEHVDENKVAAEGEEEKHASEEQKRVLSSYLNKIGRFVYNNLDEFIGNTYGSHVFRSVLEVCSGVKIEDSVKSSNKSQTKHALSHESGQIVKITPELKELLRDIAVRLQRLPDLPSIITSTSTSVAMQCALLVLKDTDEVQCHALVDHILQNGFPNILPEDNYTSNENQYHLSIFQNCSAVRLLEVMISCASAQQQNHIFTQYFKGQINTLVKHELGNFALQKLLSCWKDKEMFYELFEEVQQNLQVALTCKFTGVLFATARACCQLQTCQGRYCKELMQMLDCYEPEERQECFAQCLLRLMKYDDYKKKNDEGQLPPISLHGSLILQDVLQYNRTQKVVRSILNMSLAERQLMACNPCASHVIDAFVSSNFIKINNKNKFIQSYKGIYVALACNKHGSRSLEGMWNISSIKLKTDICEELARKSLELKGNKFGTIIYNKFQVLLFMKKDKQDWQERVDSELKKKRGLDDLLSDVTGDEPKKKMKVADEPDQDKELTEMNPRKKNRKRSNSRKTQDC